MKLVIAKEKLEHLRSMLSSVGSSNAIVQYQTYTRIGVVENGSRLMAMRIDCNKKLAVSCPLDPALGSEDGVLLVPSRFLDSFLSVATGDTVCIEAKKDSSIFEMSCGTFKSKKAMVDQSIWPANEKIEDARKLAKDIPMGALAEVIIAVSPAILVSPDDSGSSPLTGVDIVFENGGICALAGDGRRCSIMPCKFEGMVTEDNPGALLLNPEVASVVKKLGMASPDTLASIFTLPNGGLFIDTKEFKFQGKTMEKIYPDFRSKLPKEYKHALRFKASEMQRALNAVNIVFDKSELRSIILGVNDGKITIKAERYGINAGEVTHEVINATGLEGGVIDYDLCINSDFLMDAIKGKGSDETRMEMSGKDKAIVIKNNSGLNAVIMTMNREKKPKTEDKK